MEAHDLFEILVRENADMLIVFLRSILRDSASVDDVFQETMLTAWKRLDDFDRNRPFGAWLRGIASKHVQAHRRRNARLPTLCEEDVIEHLENRFVALNNQPGDILDEKLAGLRDCLASLPDRYRESIELRYRETSSAEVMADRLNLTLETFKKRLQRGRARLLECLERKLRLADDAAIGANGDVIPIL